MDAHDVNGRSGVLAYPIAHTSINPEAANYATQKNRLPKPPKAASSVEPIVGGPSLLSLNNTDWKNWRSLLNPGFSTQSLMNHVPFIVDCAQVFCDKLEGVAGQDIFSLDEYSSRMTFDVIMKVTLDSDINYQRSEHVLPTAINTIIQCHSFWDPRVLLNPLRPIVQKYQGLKLERYIHAEIHRRFEELKTKRRKASSTSTASLKRPLSVISLALEAYVAENKEQNLLETARLDRHFVSILSNNIRLFLFAGNDTTSATITFAIHLMQKFPNALSRLQQEHTNIFGIDISETGEI